MQCDCCEEREATIHLTQVVSGKARELHLCEQCAEESGLNVQGALSLPEALFGMGVQEPGDKEQEGKSCPVCHLRRGDYKKTSRLGCPACYEAFAEEMAPMLASMHKGTEHKGKIPSRAAAQSAVISPMLELQRQLEEAIRTENYEEAARLRDRIREAGG